MTVTPSSVSVNISPSAFYQYAKAFAHAANSCPATTRHEQLVQLYLYGHAIELFLKAFVLSKKPGALSARREYGHDLKKVMSAALHLGLGALVSMGTGDQQAIKELNKLYKGKHLEYFNLSSLSGLPPLPNPATIAAIVRRLEAALLSL